MLNYDTDEVMVRFRIIVTLRTATLLYDQNYSSVSQKATVTPHNSKGIQTSTTLTKTIRTKEPLNLYRYDLPQDFSFRQPL